MSIKELQNIIPLNISGSLSDFVDEPNIDSVFIEFLVYNLDDDLLNQSIIPIISVLNDSVFINNDKLLVNPGMHLRNLGFSNGIYKIKYNFFKRIVGNYLNETFLNLKNISPSRTEVEIVNTYDRSLFDSLDRFKTKNVNTLSYYLFFNNDRNFLIINKLFQNDSLYLKLYTPLLDEINLLDDFTIVQKLIDSYEDTITLHTEILQSDDNLNKLRGPNINYKHAGITYRTTPLESFETLTTTLDYKQDEIVRMYLSSSIIEGIDLNIDYRDFNNFVHFSSAESRIKNFKYKISKIEFFNSKITLLSTGSIGSASNDTFEISSSISYYKHQKDSIVNTFDNFEKFMYYQSGSYESSSLGIFPDYTWPKYTSTKPYLLYSYTSSNVTSWYNSIIESASLYDNLNPNILTNTIPVSIQLNNQNSDYTKFIQMIGQIFDINYNYINKMTSINERENCIHKGIPKELIVPVINHYGFDLRSGFVVKGLVECIPSSSYTSSL